MIYIDTASIDTQSAAVKRVVEKGFNPLVAAIQPRPTDVVDLDGIVFDTDYKPFTPKEWRSEKVGAILWYNWDMDKKDLSKLGKYFSALLRNEEFKFNYEDRLLEEYVRPVKIQETIPVQ
jgi:hypothetical protein